MNWAQWINVATSALVVAATLGFVITYNRRAPWRRSGLGRIVMAVAVAVGGFGLYTVLIWVWPTGWPAIVLRIGRIVLQLAIAGLMVSQTVILRRLQRPAPDQTEE